MKQLLLTAGMCILALLCTFVAAAQPPSYSVLRDSLTASELAEEIRGSGIAAIFNAKVGHAGPAQRGKFEAEDLPGFKVRKGILVTNGTFKQQKVPTGGISDFHFFPGLDTDSDSFLYYRDLGNCFMAGGTNFFGEDTLSSGMPKYNYWVKEAVLDSFHFGGVSAAPSKFSSLIFDFVPLYDTVRFDFVALSSVLWPLDPCPGANEYWAAIVHGPGYDNPYNVLRVPGSDAHITTATIANVLYKPTLVGLPPDHPSVLEELEQCRSVHPDAPFEEYYVNNINGETHPYTGHTTVMSFAFPVNPCDTYRIQFDAIGFAGYHTAFIIPSNSFRATGAGAPADCLADTATSLPYPSSELEPWVLYPNPSKDGFSIKFQGDYPVGHRFKTVLTDVLGNPIWEGDGKLTQLNPQLWTFSKDLPDGYYYLQLMDMENHRRMVLPAVKIR